MKAKIVSVTKNSNDFQNPQIDVVVHYVDKDFPADHQFPEGGKRQFVWTLPPEKYETMTQSEFEDMVKAQGKEFNKILKQGKEAKTKETELKSLEGTEIAI